LQAVELEASAVLHVGKVDAAHYPLAKKKTSYEFLREKVGALAAAHSHAAAICKCCTILYSAEACPMEGCPARSGRAPAMVPGPHM
jgi:hypothetical protein